MNVNKAFIQINPLLYRENISWEEALPFDYQIAMSAYSRDQDRSCTSPGQHWQIFAFKDGLKDNNSATDLVIKAPLHLNFESIKWA